MSFIDPRRSEKREKYLLKEMEGIVFFEGEGKFAVGYRKPKLIAPEIEPPIKLTDVKEEGRRHTKILDYRGFEIYRFKQICKSTGVIEYFYLRKGKQRASSLVLSGEKAAKNIIDTYHRNKIEPIYK